MPSLSRPRTVASTSSAGHSLRRSLRRGPGGSQPRTSCVSAPGWDSPESDFVSGVQTGRYEQWVLSRESVYDGGGSAGDPGGMARTASHSTRECSSTGRRLRGPCVTEASDPHRRRRLTRRLLVSLSQRVRNVRTWLVNSSLMLPSNALASRIVLFPLGRRHMLRKSVHVIENRSANFFVRWVARPKVLRRSTSGAGDTPKRRRTKLARLQPSEGSPSSSDPRRACRAAHAIHGFVGPCGLLA